LRGFGGAVTTQLGAQLSGAGRSIGMRVGRDVGTGLASGLTARLSGVVAAFDRVRDSGVESMGALVRGTTPVLDVLAKVNPVLGRVRDGFTSTAAAQSAFSGAAGSLGGHLRSLVGQVDRLATGFTAMATVSETALSRLGRTVERSLTAPVRGAANVLAAYGLSAGTALTGAGIAAAGMGVKFYAAQEQAVTAFTTMLHSGQAATEFMRQLQDFAAKTPFELPQVVTGAQRLMAFGFAARDVIPMLTAIGDAVAGMGGTAEQVDRVTIAIGQMSAKGKVQGDELLQLTEAGIPALRILANQMGLTTGELQEMITKGLVPASRAIPLLLSGIEQGTRGAAGETTAFAGMMTAQAQTLTGVWSNFKDNANKALGQLVAPAMPTVKTALGQLTAALGAVPEVIIRIRTAGEPVWAVLGAVWRDLSAFATGSLVPALRNLWSTIQPVAMIVGGAFLAALRAAGGFLRDVIGPALVTVTSWVRPLTPLLVGVAAGFATWFGISATIGAVTGALSLLRNGLTAVTTAWRVLSLAFATSPIGLVITLIAGLVTAIVWLWNNSEGFRTFFTRLWDTIGVHVMGVVNVLRADLAGAWNAIVTVVTGAVRIIRDVFVAVWEAISGYVRGVVQVIDGIITTFLGLITGNWSRAWEGIKAIAQGVWEAITSIIDGAVTIIGDIISGALSIISGVFRAAWDAMTGMVAGAWQAITGAAKTGADVMKAVFRAIDVALHAIGDAFASVAEGIRWTWDKIKEYAAAPINFVIEVVWNRGIRAVWNAITGWIPGIDLTLGELQPIRFARGGVLPGYAPGRDRVPALLSPGEAVLVPELVRLLGPDTILAANQAARRGRGGAGTGPSVGADGVPRFFLGGLWDGITSVASGIANIGRQVVGAVSDAASFVAGFVSDPFGTITALIPGLDGLARFTSAGWGKAITQLPGAAIGGIISVIKDALGLSDDGRGGPPPPPPPVGAGVEQWRGVVVQALSMLGQPLSLVPNVLRRMQQESGGNPSVVNTWDVNAQRGTPSVGLMQVIGPTFRAHAGPFAGRGPFVSGVSIDPLANVYAGLQYALRRYGSIQYAMDKPGGYDSGGWLPPGLSTVYNGTSRPEAVLTARQWDTLTAARTGGGEFTGELYLDSGALLGVVRGEIRAASEATAIAITRRTR
jgi:tape measure domain-containing protein